MNIVATSGCFDVLTPGHVDFLRRARNMDMLVVLLNSDESVTRLKGVSRPINNMWYRAMVLQELRCVDLVMLFDEDDPSAVLDVLRPAIYTKSSAYEGSPLPEKDVVQKHGGKVLFIPHTIQCSTTDTLAQIERMKMELGLII